MGLTNQSVSAHALPEDSIQQREGEQVIALAGNPNVGKSTLFNTLTGLHQHTGNWPGKTVTNAQGTFRSPTHTYRLVDIPGTYSLLAHSPEEEVARDFLCFGQPDGVVVVCDATCLERNLTLVLQILEVELPTVVCVNLMDEAQRKGIRIDIPLLEKRLGVPVIATVARQKTAADQLAAALDKMMDTPVCRPSAVTYPAEIESALSRLQPVVQQHGGSHSRWLSLQLLEGNGMLSQPPQIEKIVQEERAAFSTDDLQDEVVAAVTETAHRLCKGVVRQPSDAHRIDRRIDRLVTGRRFGYPLMVLLLMLVLWLTMEGANLPSQWLSTGLSWVGMQLSHLLIAINAPLWLHSALVDGVWQVLAWVVAVMLPPMAIFFPLFTLMEDVGLLPRIAYNLDRPFARCHACGKQALTMCMGFGCNAAGVVGCRIIDSPRERLLAILTNSLVPCNGRFPTLITLLTLFFVGGIGGWMAALLLTGLILLGVVATFVLTKLLAVTVLRGQPSAFTLELPPYRPPRVGQVILRSMLDRTLFVLGRAAAVAAPAGLIIWLLGNLTIGDGSVLSHTAILLNPIGQLLGMDGAILLAFLLGFPANEIVLPLLLMIYLSQGTLPPTDSLTFIRTVLIDNGWTWVTAACTMVFSLFHWPCSTTLLTIRKEAGGRWAVLAAVLPTLLGTTLCGLIHGVATLFGV